MFVVRHATSGAPYLIARHASESAPHVHVINAGDGRHAHPTQGLLDMYTIRHYKKDFSNLTVAIVGDILHSRVARSDIHALTTLGVPDVRAVGPLTLLPAGLEQMGVRVFTKLDEGIRGADVIIMLRLQNERMRGALLPSAQEYFAHYGLTPERLAHAKPGAIVMHPGPMNRGVEIDSRVADGSAARHPAAGDFRHCGAHGGDVDRRVVGEDALTSSPPRRVGIPSAGARCPERRNRIFRAAFTSRSSSVPQCTQIQLRSFRPVWPLGPAMLAHSWQVWVVYASLTSS